MKMLHINLELLLLLPSSCCRLFVGTNRQIDASDCLSSAKNINLETAFLFFALNFQLFGR